MNKTKICNNKKSLAFLLFYATIGFGVSFITSSCGSENNVQKQTDNEKDKLKKEIDELNKNINILQTKFENIEPKSEMQTKVETLSASIKKFQQKLTNKPSTDDLQQEITNLSKEIEDFQGAFDTNQPEKGDEQTAKEELKNAITNLKEQLNNINTQKSDTMINNLCKTMDDFKSILDKLKDKQKSEMQTKIDDCSADIEHLKNKLNTDQSNEDLINCIESCTQKLTTLKEGLEDDNSESSNKKTIQNLCEDIENFKKQILNFQEANTNVNGLFSANQKLTQGKKDLQKQCQNQQKELANLKNIKALFGLFTDKTFSKISIHTYSKKTYFNNNSFIKQYDLLNHEEIIDCLSKIVEQNCTFDQIRSTIFNIVTKKCENLFGDKNQKPNVVEIKVQYNDGKRVIKTPALHNDDIDNKFNESLSIYHKFEKSLSSMIDTRYNDCINATQQSTNS